MEIVMYEKLFDSHTSSLAFIISRIVQVRIRKVYISVSQQYVWNTISHKAFPQAIDKCSIGSSCITGYCILSGQRDWYRSTLLEARRAGNMSACEKLRGAPIMSGPTIFKCNSVALMEASMYCICISTKCSWNWKNSLKKSVCRNQEWSHHKDNRQFLPFTDYCMVAANKSKWIRLNQNTTEIIFVLANS